MSNVGIRWMLSDRHSGARLAEQPAPQALDHAHSASNGHHAPALWVDTSRRFQTMEGFGGAFTEAAAVTWQALPTEAQARFLSDCFDPVHGHGYTLGRVHMNSCDFALGNYAHVEQAGDHLLQSFNIDRDRQALLPFIRAALEAAGRPLRLLVSPWSPPAWMKTNGEMNHGGALKPECRAAWAQCYVRFIQAYETEGVPVWAVSVQNEPMAHQRWDSCIYSAEEERDFVRDHLGPALHQAGLGHVKIVIWDHNRDLMVERASVVYRDPEAAKYVWGTGFHWYGNDCFDHVQLVHDAWPDKALLFTEGCQEGGPHNGSWEVGERYAHSITNDINRWTVGWIDWNLLLNEQGGPNHVGNFCSAPILADRHTGQLRHQSAYAVLGHFARFVRPGAQRVLCASPRSEIEATAFANAEGDTVVVATNRHEHGVAMQLVINGQRWAVDIPPRSISTFVASA